MIIRPERPEDIDAIFALTQAAFADRPFSQGTEGPIINALRESGEMTLSLVAEEDGEIIGQITFSPIRIGDEHQDLYGLGPVAANVERRHQGIGSALIQDGLAQIKAMGAKACVLVGDPNYYSRFGFVGDCGLTHGTVPLPAVQILSFDGQPRRGEIHYAASFDR